MISSKNWFITNYCVECDENKSCSKERTMELCIEIEKLYQTIQKTQYLDRIDDILLKISTYGLKIDSADYQIAEALENLNHEIRQRGISVTVSRRD